MDEPSSVIVVDDHALFRMGVLQALSAHKRFAVVTRRIESEVLDHALDLLSQVWNFPWAAVVNVGSKQA